MNTSWYPSSKEWEDFTDWDWDTGELVTNWLDSLEFWRDKLGVTPASNRPGLNDDIAWLKDRILQARVELLPVPKVVTAEQLLDLCHNQELRAVFGRQLCENCACEEGIVYLQHERTDDKGEYLWIDDEYDTSQCLSGEDWPFEEGLSGILTIHGSEEYAKRIAAWLDFAWGQHQPTVDDQRLDIRWLKNGLDDLNPDGLAADHLESLAYKIEEHLTNDEHFLESLDESVTPEDMIHPGLERAVREDRAGRRMREELEEQEHERDVVQDGWEGLSKRRKKLEQLERRIAELRGQDVDTREDTSEE